jgi:catechol 1,2-dioxygenase
VYGRVLDAVSGRPLAGAEVDVWQNGVITACTRQDPNAPEEHLRGRFRTHEDGSYAFLAVRPTPYPIADDGPVGNVLAATGRHPWRPAHIHIIVRANGYQTLVTHIFDRDSEYLDSDTVFAAKPSLLRTFERRDPDDPERSNGVEGEWCALECTLTLAPGEAAEVNDPGRTA